MVFVFVSVFGEKYLELLHTICFFLWYMVYTYIHMYKVHIHTYIGITMRRINGNFTNLVERQFFA